ncbi:nicotinamidase-like [Zophobas morio]|uniref:nicotinamidase-like n=1 Tax=Zophobas morio TaxID=2755281 RepID=UPI0030839B81
MKALIVVDLQYDFVPPDGKLAVPGGAELPEKISNLCEALKKKGFLIVGTQDWHPRNHGSFASTHSKPPFTMGELSGAPQMLWPDHCVQESKGAELDSLVKGHLEKVIQKGTNPAVDSYSGFFDNNKNGDTGLNDYLQANNIKKVYVCGLALDYCVKFTCLDAVALHYDTNLITDLCRAVTVQGGIDALKELKLKKVKLVDSKELLK